MVIGNCVFSFLILDLIVYKWNEEYYLWMFDIYIFREEIFFISFEY